MSLNLQIINPLTHPEWDSLITSTRNYSFFHTSAWARVLCETYGYTPLYFTHIENGTLQVAIPLMEVKSFLTGKRGVSLPFTDYCEPINSNSINLRDIYKHLIEHGKQAGWKYIEFKGGSNFFRDTPPSSCYDGHSLDLAPNEKNIFSKFKKGNKSNIKKAIKEGVEVRYDRSIELMKEFYRLNCITRKMHGLPPQPYLFFKKIYQHIISKDLGHIFLGLYDKKYIAGAIYFHIGEQVLYKYSASDKKYQNLRANNLVMWEAIKWYNKNGYKRIMFGRTETNNKGLLHYKESWGTKKYTINYFKYNCNSDKFIQSILRTKGFHNKLFSKLPVMILRVIGAGLYKHIG